MEVVRAIVFALALLSAAGAASADQKDGRLDGLFDQLLELPDHSVAQVVEGQIWRIWFEHDDSAIVLLMEQGQSAMGRRDFKSALRSFDQVVAIDPDFAEGWNRRATLHYLMGDYEASLDDIKRTLALEPRHFGALSGRGLVYAALEEWDLALGSFEAALDVNPHMIGARINAEAIRNELGNRDI